MLSQFSADVNNGKVLLAWTLKSGSICNGIDILRSVDSLNFDVVGHIGGVCGAINSPVSYTYTDTDPVKNTINYYKIDLGGQEISKVVSVEVIDVSGTNYLLQPNPLGENSELHVANDNSSDLELSIYDGSGILLRTAVFSSKKFVLSKNNFNSGMHFFTIINKTTGEVINGRFIVD